MADGEGGAIREKGMAAACAIMEQVDHLTMALERHETGREPTSVAEWEAQSKDLKEGLVRAQGTITTQLAPLKGWTKQREEARKQAEEWYEHLQNQHTDRVSEIETLQQRAQDAERETQELINQQEDRAAEIAEAERQKEEGSDDYRAPPPSDPGSRYVCFLAGRADILVEMDAATARFETLHGEGTIGGDRGDPRVWGDVELQELCSEAERFAERITETEAQVRYLEQLVVPLQEQGGSWERVDTSLEEANDSLGSAQVAFQRWNRKLSNESERRAKYESNMDDYMANQRKLSDWCADQKVKLEAHFKAIGQGGEPGGRKHAHEFCQSLQSRIPSMEQNFAVLTGMAEDLVPGSKSNIVEAALVSATTDWLRLQIQAYDLLSETLMSEHRDSGLKEECKAFSALAKTRLKPFLDTVEELLRTGEEDQGKRESIVRPVLLSCKQLQQDFSPFQLIVDHLHDFEVRMDIISNHYEKLKHTLLSRLTEQCLRLNLLNGGFKGSEDQEEQMANITSWIETKDSNVEAWDTVDQRLEQIKALIDNEAETDVALEDL